MGKGTGRSRGRGVCSWDILYERRIKKKRVNEGMEKKSYCIEIMESISKSTNGLEFEV